MVNTRYVHGEVTYQPEETMRQQQILNGEHEQCHIEFELL